MENNMATLGERIAALRRARGMTQEQLAQWVGVSGAAVSKWETAASCPDVSLLCPLARALGTNVDALLGFDAELTPQAMGEQLAQVQLLAQSGDVEGALALLDRLVSTWPGSDQVLFNAAGMLDVLRMALPDAPQAERDAWDARKRRWLEAVHTRGKAPYQRLATLALATMTLAEEDTARAETLLNELDTPQVSAIDPVLLRIQLHLKRGECEQAQRAAQGWLLGAVVQTQQALSMLMDERIEPDAQRVLAIAELLVRLETDFGVNPAAEGMRMEAYLRLGQRDEAKQSAIRLLHALTQTEQSLNPLVFAALGVRRMPDLLRTQIVRSLSQDEAFADFRADAAFAHALACAQQQAAEDTSHSGA